MTTFYMRIAIIVSIILMTILTHCNYRSMQPIRILIDNSQSMRLNNRDDLQKWIDANNLETYMFGEKTELLSAITFDDSQSKLDWDRLSRDYTYVLVSDGYFQEIGKRPETVIPVRLDTSGHMNEVILTDVRMPSKTVKNKRETISLLLSSLASKSITCSLIVRNDNEKLIEKRITLEPHSSIELNEDIMCVRTGLNTISITVQYLSMQQTITGYIQVEHNKRQILVTGELSPELTYLRRYFVEHPMYDVHTLVRIGERFLYDNDIIEKQPFVDLKHTGVITIGKEINPYHPDIVILSGGKTLRTTLHILDLMQEPIPIQGVVISDIVPDEVINRAGGYPVLFVSGKTVYTAIPDFYTIYIHSFHHYDAIMRRIMDIHEHLSHKYDSWSLITPVLYQDSDLILQSNSKMQVTINAQQLHVETTFEGYRYQFPIGKTESLSLRIGNEEYNLKTVSKKEKVYFEQNIDTLSTYSGGFYISPDDAIMESITNVHMQSLYFIQHPWIALVILLLLSLIWWKEHSR